MENIKEALDWWRNLTPMQKLDVKWLYCGSSFDVEDLSDKQIEKIYNYIRI